MTPTFLFCQSPFDKKQVDPDFQIEFIAVKENGFEILLFNYDLLTENHSIDLSKIKDIAIATPVIYRGWMLTAKQYTILYNYLSDRNYILINNPEEYQNCHYLPNSLQFIENQTPKTIYEYLTDENSIDNIIRKAKAFGDRPVVIKDFVKSEKHNWEDACFVSNASDEDELRSKIDKFLLLRDKYLNEGIVIREFLQFKPLSIHSKSGMPLTEEYRLFFYKNKLVGKYNYWEEGQYANNDFDTGWLEKIALGIKSIFFSMDIARMANNEFIIVELGDGQVAGLPDAADPVVFFKNFL